MRITYKMLKKWLLESNIYVNNGFWLTAFNGYYHIKDKYGEDIICDESPRKVWEQWKIFEKGYNFARG